MRGTRGATNRRRINWQTRLAAGQSVSLVALAEQYKRSQDPPECSLRGLWQGHP